MGCCQFADWIYWSCFIQEDGHLCGNRAVTGKEADIAHLVLGAGC